MTESKSIIEKDLTDIKNLLKNELNKSEEQLIFSYCVLREVLSAKDINPLKNKAVNETMRLIKDLIKELS